MAVEPNPESQPQPNELIPSTSPEMLHRGELGDGATDASRPRPRRSDLAFTMSGTKHGGVNCCAPTLDGMSRSASRPKTRGA